MRIDKSSDSPGFLVRYDWINLGQGDLQPQCHSRNLEYAGPIVECLVSLAPAGTDSTPIESAQNGIES